MLGYDWVRTSISNKVMMITFPQLPANQSTMNDSETWIENGLSKTVDKRQWLAITASQLFDNDFLG